eukprot:CAMPEP_0206016960 /NCGR_PEP_ID=MMETSP1464-20131121/23975_1 /ASSEMBLY_ACC=CAM_ASM_001124 /TAXON_ID=119497 /ORGANISM="Exanthemachrysis gayraliae, Strain RCC1523" /LENGTH=189 /DNA_ID=CAMNT_0053390791 /DNA_START=36 /DNA_END=605 /DNA_ORIENTATION=+
MSLFRDPMLRDTRLTPVGEAQADALAASLGTLADEVELVVASPLSRALDTATRAFRRRPDLPVVAHPALRERQKRYADLGRPRSCLEEEFGAASGAGLVVDFGLLPEEGNWGYTPPEDIDGAAVPEEAEAPFLERLASFADWLGARPERCVAVVCHKGVVRGLTGRAVANCEVVECALEELRPGMHAMS